MQQFLGEQSPCIVAMEACATSHFWGRFARSHGHDVRLIPPIYVKPFVKRQKNDAADAAAIAEAALRPNMHYVAVKSAEHQARAVAFRTHQCFVRQRTQLINALRGHLAEFGIVVAQGPANLGAVAGILAEEAVDLPDGVRVIGQLYLDQIGMLSEKIDELSLKLREATKSNEDMRRLCTVPGVGPVTAGAILAFAPDLRAKAAFAARLGGDEFALFQIGPSLPETFSREIVTVLKKPFLIGGRTIEIGGSVGHCSRRPWLDPLELVRRADMALYKAKQLGKGRAFAYAPDLDAEREEQACLEGQLRRAIADDAIKPAFQPLVSVASQKICGVEALARWHSPAGFVAPDVFIPLAERSGLIDDLGMKILTSSIRAASGWKELSLSVNISPIQLCNPNFVDDVTNLLAKENFDPHRLTLEITEGVLISNPDQARRAINALKERGIRFALDDFGCGFASIGALRQFGFDRMKLDRSLVWGLDDEGRGSGILKATIALAAALNIPVTAEGIETETQAKALGAAGCDQLQGYLVGKPMSAQDLGHLVSSKRLVA